MKPENTHSLFAARESVEQVEEGNQLAPKFDAQGVIPCITLHAQTREA
jgi:phosphoribosyl-AMP cyclohydrolase